MSQSKLSEALALTLMCYKEIDRDTIEALCKRAASLEQDRAEEYQARLEALSTLRETREALGAANEKLQEMSVWRSNDNRREREHNAAMQCILAALGLSVLETADCAVTKVQALLKSHTQLQWALRDLLAHTREYDDAGPEGEGYQSKALQNAIDTADALVGADVTDQFPIADEPLNRRIQELEVALAAKQKEKQGNIYIDKDLISLTQGGETRVRVGKVPSADETGPGTTTAGVDTGFLAQAAEKTSSAVHEALPEGLVPRTVFFKPAAELKPEMQPRRWSEQSLRALIRDIVSATQTVDVPADFELHTVVTINGPVEATNKLVKEIIAQEMRPGGRIHSALIKR